MKSTSYRSFALLYALLCTRMTEFGELNVLYQLNFILFSLGLCTLCGLYKQL